MDADSQSNIDKSLMCLTNALSKKFNNEEKITDLVREVKSLEPAAFQVHQKKQQLI